MIVSTFFLSENQHSSYKLLIRFFFGKISMYLSRNSSIKTRKSSLLNYLTLHIKDNFKFKMILKLECLMIIK